MPEKPQDPQVGTRLPEATQPPQAERKHPQEWERDLNPNRMDGQNIGAARDFPNAHDIPDLRRALSDFSADELQEIAVVPPGSRLQQGATYLNLSVRDRDEFTATGEMLSGADEYLVPKSEVPYTLYNRLRGIDDPRRTT